MTLFERNYLSTFMDIDSSKVDLSSDSGHIYPLRAHFQTEMFSAERPCACCRADRYAVKTQSLAITKGPHVGSAKH